MRIKISGSSLIFSLFIAAIFSTLSVNARAEYYVAYSSAEPCSQCFTQPRVAPRRHYVRHYAPPTCRPRHHVYHRPHYRRSHYSIAVYYYQYSMTPPPCPCDYQCGAVSCQQPCQEQYQQCAPPPCQVNYYAPRSSCHHRYTRHHYAPRHSSCGCRRYNTCEQNRAPSIVQFSGEPTSWNHTRLYTNEETEPSRYLDRSTADDDSNAYPEMNIDH
jgi:hypothetical protein